MKRILVLWLAAMLVAVQPCYAVVMVGFGQSTEPPAMTLLDDFNRDNGAIGSSWEQAGSWATPLIDTNQLKGTPGDNSFAYWVNTFAANQRAQIKLNALSNAGSICVRVQTDSDSGYCVKLQSSSELRITKTINGSETNLQSISRTISAGDTIGISIAGVNPGTITAFHNGSSLTPTVTDSDYDAGQPGVYIWDSAVRLDDFYAGEL